MQPLKSSKVSDVNKTIKNKVNTTSLRIRKKKLQTIKIKYLGASVSQGRKGTTKLNFFLREVTQFS